MNKKNSNKEVIETGPIQDAEIIMRSRDGVATVIPAVTNIRHHQTFKPYDKVLVKGTNRNNETVWILMIYSMFDSVSYSHILTSGISIKDEDIKSFNLKEFNKWYNGYNVLEKIIDNCKGCTINKEAAGQV